MTDLLALFGSHERHGITTASSYPRHVGVDAFCRNRVLRDVKTMKSYTFPTTRRPAGYEETVHVLFVVVLLNAP